MLTPEQITEIRAKSGLKPLGQLNNTRPQNTNFVGKFDYLKPKSSVLMEGIKSDLGKRIESIRGSITKNAGGGGMRESLNIVGQAAGGIVDVVGRTASTAFDAGTTELSKHVSGTPSKLEQKGIELLESPIGKKAIAAVKGGVEMYNGFKQSNPDIARDFENVVNIASVLPGFKLASSVIKGSIDLAGQGVGSVIKTAGEGLSAVKTSGKKIVSSIANSEFVSPIEAGVKNELKKSALPELDKYIQVAKEGAIDYSKPSALDIVGEEASKTVKIIKDKLSTIGEMKSKITDALSSVNTGNIVYQTRNELRDLIKTRLGAFFNKVGDVVSAPGRIIKISDGEAVFLKKVDDMLRKISTNQTFRKVDDTIDAIQNELYNGKQTLIIPNVSKVDGVIGQITTSLNNKLKAIGGASYKIANSKYSEYIKVMNELNELLGKGGKNGAAVMKRIFSPSDAGTKKLFNKVKELTGVDLIKESTLAKYAMEKVGDARSASLLEQMKMLVGGGKMGMIEKAANFALEKAKDPIEAAKKYLKQ